ncbi:MAG: class I SAM-dependent methyltransferase, partial [Solirubrobacteraceae bacterium]
TLDPTFVPGQARAARWLLSRDRGQAVRDPAGYQALASSHFAQVTATVRHDLARVPYTHAILECRSPRAARA